MANHTQTEIETFEGFPAAGLHFMQDLAANNEKEWFDAHRETYRESVQAPAIALVETLGSRLQAHFPAVRYDTRLNGSGSLMRINRDIRFSADKSPYKTNIAMGFPLGEGKKMTVPSFGVQLSLTGVGVMAGVFGFDKGALARYRRAVDEDQTGKALETAADEVRAAGEYSLQGEKYKRVPRGYDADHPRANWLKYGGLWASAPEMDLDIAQSAALVDALVQRCEEMSPILLWLIDAVYGG